MRVSPWTVLSSEDLLDCRIFRIERTFARSPVDRTVHDFFRIRSADWSHVVPVTADDDVVMVRQYRHGSGEMSLEVPAGIIEPGEEPARAAARECLEETGYATGELRPLGVLCPNPAVFANRLHTFAAYGVQRVAEIRQTATEHTAVELVPIARLRALLTDGRIDNALDVATLWRFLHEHPQRHE